MRDQNGNEMRFTPGGALFALGTRAQYAPTPGALNVSLDFNAAPSGSARGTEVIIPDDASPEVRAAAEAYNNAVVAFAEQNGISGYPNRGVRTRSENGRGVAHTVHTEPFFNSDSAMQAAIQSNPAAFAAIYRDTFGALENARVIAAHGVGGDRGASSDVFGSETDFGNLMLATLMGREIPERSQAAATMQAASAQNAGDRYLAARRATPFNGDPSAALQRGPNQVPETPLTGRDKLAYVGQALLALDQGQMPSAPPTQGTERPQIDLAEILDKMRGSPVFPRTKRGLSL